jgi:hypothetical protein
MRAPHTTPPAGDTSRRLPALAYQGVTVFPGARFIAAPRIAKPSAAAAFGAMCQKHGDVGASGYMKELRQQNLYS